MFRIVYPLSNELPSLSFPSIPPDMAPFFVAISTAPSRGDAEVSPGPIAEPLFSPSSPSNSLYRFRYSSTSAGVAFTSSTLRTGCPVTGSEPTQPALRSLERPRPRLSADSAADDAFSHSPAASARGDSFASAAAAARDPFCSSSGSSLTFRGLEEALRWNRSVAIRIDARVSV